MSNRFKKVFSWLIVLSGLAVIIWLLIRGWYELSAALTDVSWTLFASSVVTGIAGTAVVGRMFQSLLKKYGLAVSAVDSQKLVFYGQVVKYVPGKVWPILYQASTVGGAGGRAIKGTAAANLDLMLVSLISSTMLGAALLLYPEHFFLSLLVIGIGCSFTVFSVSECFVSDTIRWTLSKTGLRWNKIEIACSRAKTDLSLVLSCAALFLLPIMAYFFMIEAVFHLSSTEMIAVTAYLLLAWSASTLTLVVPAGLGVKEMIFIGLGTLSAVDVSAEKLVAIAVVSRFWQVLQDVGGGAILLLVVRARGK